MTRGKPWAAEEEKRLKELYAAGKSAIAIADSLGKSVDCVKMKITRLGLKVVVTQNCATTTTDKSLELPSIEEALKTLTLALKALETPGLDKAETLRLRSIIQGVRTYIERFADFLNYRELEQRLIELEGKYATLAKSTSKPSTA